MQIFITEKFQSQRLRLKLTVLWLCLCLSVFLFLDPAKADAVRCSRVYTSDNKSKNLDRTSEFIILISGTEQSQRYLSLAHSHLISSFELDSFKHILKLIKKNGAENLMAEQTQFILKFRQNTSVLRSIFQTSDQKHKSPRDFAHFVRDIGILKDLIVMKDSEKSRVMAANILRKYSELNFADLTQQMKPATKESVQKYFLAILQETQGLMNQNQMSVRELHEVRKNLRDVLRFLQVQNEVDSAASNGLVIQQLGQNPNLEATPAIRYLKKINAKLGIICDDYAAQILNGKLAKDTPVGFPEALRAEVEKIVENFLNNIET